MNQAPLPLCFGPHRPDPTPATVERLGEKRAEEIYWLRLCTPVSGSGRLGGCKAPIPAGPWSLSSEQHRRALDLRGAGCCFNSPTHIATESSKTPRSHSSLHRRSQPRGQTHRPCKHVQRQWIRCGTTPSTKRRPNRSWGRAIVIF